MAAAFSMTVDGGLVSGLSTSGVYTLILFVPKETAVTVGHLGTQRFPRGHYTYTGSALGKGSSNLKHRLSRHLRKEKRRFWHIDYLLADQNVSVEAVVAAETNKKMECTINSYIKQIHGQRPGAGPHRQITESCRRLSLCPSGRMLP